jgi:transposase
MERDWLARELEAGRSIEDIAREVGRHASTVAYWASRHGLVSAHAARHANRGGLSSDVLSALVVEGLSTREMAARLQCSAATVRHWLRTHGLETRRTASLRATREGRAGGDGAAVRVCATHGATSFVLDSDGYYRCPRCRADAVVRRRADIRSQVIADAGGACALCGYARNPAALHFHHVDPSTKSFSLRNGHTRSLERMRAEAAKCVLLCANCHAEVESGSTPLAVPSEARTRFSGVAQRTDPG